LGSPDSPIFSKSLDRVLDHLYLADDARTTSIRQDLETLDEFLHDQGSVTLMCN
jgi:hypothetical protein